MWVLRSLSRSGDEVQYPIMLSLSGCRTHNLKFTAVHGRGIWKGLMAQKQWAEASINPLVIQLDSQNPRIEVAGDAEQNDIRLKLVAHENVVKLAVEIIAFGGLMPGERIIVVKENRKYVVVEGNRRVCACQLLLKPELVPEKYRKRFPIANNDLKEALKDIKAEVAPDRDAAEPTITKRHTEPGIERWSPTAKMRRASKLLEAGYSLDQIAEKLGAQKTKLRASIREYRLLRYAIELDHHAWTQAELDRLTDQTLQTNPYTRFFSLAGAKEKIGLSFDENDHVMTKLSKGEFDQYMEHIARCFLIPVPPNKKPRANSRTTVDDIFTNFSPKKDGKYGEATASTGRVGSASSASAGTSSGGRSSSVGGSGAISGSAVSNEGTARGASKEKVSKPKAARASTFFEKLICAIDDDRLIALTGEITRINPNDFPIASMMLLRALFESALTYQVRKAGLQKDLNKKTNGKDVTLQTLMNFCANPNNAVFDHKRAADLLGSFEKAGMKDHIDFVVHGRWAEADAAVVVTAGRLLRPLIKHILEVDHNEVEEENA